MIILPKGFDPGKWQRSFIGTGPFMLKSYTPKVGASFTRNEQLLGHEGPAGRRPSSPSTTLRRRRSCALTGGTIDVVGQFSVTGGEQLLNGGLNVIKLKSSAHRELSMRNDQAPFTDPRVRQAIALTLDRPAIVQALFKGYADLGNDSPFAPVFPSTNTSVPQRAKDLAKAKSLLSGRRSQQRLLDPADRQRRPGDPARTRRSSRRRPSHRREHQPHDRGLVDLLRQGDLRELRLAGRHDEPGRLRRTAACRTCS